MVSDSGWTVDTLKEYLVGLIADHDKRYEQRHQANKEAINAALTNAQIAVSKAETAVEKRLEGTNEWRDALNDHQRTYMPRAEAQVLLDALGERIDKLDSVADRSRGLTDGWSRAIAVAAVLIAAYSLAR